MSDMAYKVCSKCKKELPATSEYFYKQSRSKDGLTIYCMIAVKISRECHRPKRDNRVDIAGYAEALDMVVNYREHGER